MIRARDTCNIALGFPDSPIYKEDRRLREIYFGKHENTYFHSLEKHEKDHVNSREYNAPEGESW